MSNIADRLKRLQRSIIDLEVTRQTEGGGTSPEPTPGTSTVKHYRLTGQEVYRIVHNQGTEILSLDVKTDGRDGVPLYCSYRIIDANELELQPGITDAIEVIVTYHRFAA